MVSQYKPNNCKYRIDKLAKVVYLVSEDALKNIHIDNGYAYIGGLTEEPMALEVYDVNLSDGEELDERYKFTHTLTFKMNGYANYTMFNKKYYAIVKSLDGVYWFVNPMFPNKVSYTYTLDSNGSHTDFRMATISNHPTLRLEGFDAPTPNVCLGYTHCTFDRLRLNETKYSRKGNNIVRYTNDGFKDVVYKKNSAVFTETFDGSNISHSLTFNVDFDDYKSSWHYNLLEFVENKYAAIIRTSCGMYLLSGFGFGLNPSFNVSANSNEGLDNIQIQMSDLHDNGDFIWYDDDLTITKSEGSDFVFTSEHYGYECVDENVAKYLLKEEVDKFGNPLGNYLVLEGYENSFPNLNIVGEFTVTEEFYNATCEASHCRMQTSFPMGDLVFNVAGCRVYYLLCETDWTLSSSSSNDITVYPTSGAANTPYEIQICNWRTPTSTEFNATITASYCGKTKQYNVSVIEGDSCFTAGQTFDISANGQYVTIPTQCCVSSVAEQDSLSAINNINIQNNYIRVFVPQNDTNSARTFVLYVSFCDNNGGYVTINQGVGFERWIVETWACSGGLKCDVERKYTGLTPYDCNAYTTFTRLTNCVQSDDCSGLMTRWVETTATTCDNGKKFIVEEEQESTDEGITWTANGNKRVGYEISDPTGECEGVETEEEWRVIPNEFECDDTTKYTKERLYTRIVGQEEWMETQVTKIGNTVLELESEDCGFIKGSDDWKCEKWEVSDGYICDETTKYAREQRYVCDFSGECSAATEWIATGVYRRTDTVLETDSIDCGYTKGTDEWSCSEWRDVPDEYFCEGTTKYNKQRLYQRDCTNCSNCSSPWYATYIYRRGSTVLDTNSTDCGYVKASDEWTCEKWEVDEESYICEGATEYAVEQRFVRDCIDCNDCHADWIPTGVFRRTNTVLSENSERCGYDPSITGNCSEYRDEGNTICDGYAEYKYLHKYVRNCNDCNNCSNYWVATKLYMRGQLIKSKSFECGYIPVANYTEWREDGYICDGYNLYKKLVKWISEDGEDDNWYETTTYMRGDLVTEKSTKCGYVPIANYTEWRDFGTMCDGYNLYYRKQKWISADNENWVGTNITKQGNLIENNSFDCGYIPTENFIRWEVVNTMCDGYNLYNLEKKWISDNGNRWYETEITRKGALIETNSESCHYVDPIQYEYRWVLTTATTCEGITKYYLYKKQRRRRNLGDEWSDVVPTYYSYNGDGTMTPQVVEAESEDCGYVPPVDAIYKWENIDPNVDWICDECE